MGTTSFYRELHVLQDSEIQVKYLDNQVQFFPMGKIWS